MKPVCTAEQVRAWEGVWIGEHGLPSLALMEVAARGVAALVVERFAEQASQGVVVACGPGNNGADGYAIARWLRSAGVPVRVWPVVPPKSEEGRFQAGLCERLGVVETGDLVGAGLIVDALLGNGATRALDGGIEAAVNAVNASGLAVLSVDLPTGLEASLAGEAGPVVRAQLTAVLGVHKEALCSGRAQQEAGEVVLVPLGLEAAPSPLGAAELWEPADVVKRWPLRKASAYKTHSGHLGIIAGSVAMAGAAVLCARAALSMGVGLVTLAVPEGALVRLAGLPVEVMVHTSGPGPVLEAVPELPKCSALLIGPGLSGGRPLRAGIGASLGVLWREDPRPVLFDADALVAVQGGGAGPRVHTPHEAEAARVLGWPVERVRAERVAAAQALADRVGPAGVALLKGPFTVIASAERRAFNPTGDATLATGGSGDVLAGMIAGLLARGLPAFEAAAMGAYVHGLAGELAGRARGEAACASDLPVLVPEALSICGLSFPRQA